VSISLGEPLKKRKKIVFYFHFYFKSHPSICKLGFWR